MGWDKGGRYYTRSRRENGRVVREHVGGGMIGQLAAELDTIDRSKREANLAAARAEQEEIAALDAPLHELNELADLLVRVAFVATGHHQHHRGEWRKRRGQHNEG